MAERIFIGVAWPYANGPLHMGHIAGCYLPADIFARFHRAKGNPVLMVSGSDAHGTANTVRAEEEGVSTEVIVDRYHASFVESWERLGISWDLYTSTRTENHALVTQDMFRRLLERGHIYEDTMSLPFCPKESRFLPDRYVFGTCPRCGSTNARGDECDACGHPLDPFDLVEPRCRFCGATPVERESQHFFLRLSGFADQLYGWVSAQGHWRPNVQNFTLGFLEEGLRDRAITRDIEWGVPIPLPGYEDKRLYVWFENVIGYLSASKEWAQRQGDPEAWRVFWEGDSKGYYFIGKDNIFFHTLSWPAEILGYGGLNLPYDVPANEFLTLERQQLSTSRNWAAWVSDYLERYDPDPLRYYLAATMPETSDSDFSWRDFVRRNNNELVGTYGNLVHRVLTLLQRHFEGRMPELEGGPDPRSQEVTTRSEEALREAEQHLAGCRFRAALNVNMRLARETNRYLEEKAPWRTALQDRAETARTLHTAMVAIGALRILMLPFLPFSSQKLHEMLGFEGSVQDTGWVPSPPPVGQEMQPPEPLFVKLDEEEVIQRETTRLGMLGSR